MEFFKDFDLDLLKILRGGVNPLEDSCDEQTGSGGSGNGSTIGGIPTGRSRCGSCITGF